MRRLGRKTPRALVIALILAAGASDLFVKADTARARRVSALEDEM